MVMEQMTEHLISVKDFAEQNGLLKQTVFKVLKRLEIEPSNLDYSPIFKV